MSRPEASAAAGAGSGKGAKARSPEEIVHDIEAERGGLRDSVDALKGEVDAFKAKLRSPRVLGAVGGTIGGLILLRILRRRR